MLGTFDEVITNPHRLREIIGEPRGYSAQKGTDRIDDIFRRFIAATPFVAVATHGADGLLDISPKGDPAGFVEVLDEKTLVIPDRLGNQRLDTFVNLLANPAIALIFIIPGNIETLRVAGTARIVRDSALQKCLAVMGKEPVLCLVVNVEEAFMHCPKAMVRSKMWKPEEWPDRSNVPKMMESVKANAKAVESVEELQRREDIVTVTRLY
jgi:PPOX class probable FMN-dependent enzyme